MYLVIILLFLRSFDFIAHSTIDRVARTNRYFSLQTFKIYDIINKARGFIFTKLKYYFSSYKTSGGNHVASRK